MASGKQTLCGKDPPSTTRTVFHQLFRLGHGFNSVTNYQRLQLPLDHPEIPRPQPPAGRSGSPGGPGHDPPDLDLEEEIGSQGQSEHTFQLKKELLELKIYDSSIFSIYFNLS